MMGGGLALNQGVQIGGQGLGRAAEFFAFVGSGQIGAQVHGEAFGGGGGLQQARAGLLTGILVDLAQEVVRHGAVQGKVGLFGGAGAPGLRRRAAVQQGVGRMVAGPDQPRVLIQQGGVAAWAEDLMQQVQGLVCGVGEPQGPDAVRGINPQARQPGSGQVFVQEVVFDQGQGLAHGGRPTALAGRGQHRAGPEAQEQAGAVLALPVHAQPGRAHGNAVDPAAQPFGAQIRAQVLQRGQIAPGRGGWGGRGGHRAKV